MIIGCGAVTEQFHLPALQKTAGIEVTALVDKNTIRARQLADQYNIEHVLDDYADLKNQADAAIIALPHFLHAPATLDIIQKGMHVLVEKPMALSSDECTRMIAAARNQGVTLAVGLMRRFQNSHQVVHDILSKKMLGGVESFDLREGSVFSWPIASDFFFKRQFAGGGVLIDTGAHTLDTLIWWLGEPETIHYYDDNYGGVEADCHINLTMENGAEGVVELSRTRNLRNTARIRCSEGILEVEMIGSHITIKPDSLDSMLWCDACSNQIPASSDRQYLITLFMAQLDDWLRAIQEEREPLVSGETARRSIGLIEECYAHRKSLKIPWNGPISLAQKETAALKGKKVLVTGGTGFIGGRLIECLVRDCEADVRVLVRNFTRIPRIARFPLETIHGDVTDLETVIKAVDGCEIVFHCAYGNRGTPAQQKSVNVEGTENVLKAALAGNVKRVVHISTLSVYGQTADDELDESAPRKYSQEVYGDSKLDAERIVFSYFREFGLPVTVIQPTVVYGPLAPAWTVGPLNRLKSGRMILVDNGQGLCNAVYINNVIQALILAAVKESAIGQAFLISGEKPVTWKDFFEGYEQILNEISTVSMNESEIRAFMKQYKREHNTLKQIMRLPGEVMGVLFSNPKAISNVIRGPAFSYLAGTYRPLLPRSIDNRILSIFSKGGMESSPEGEKPILPLTKKEIAYYRAKTRVNITKAKEYLGYHPEYALDEGMLLTKKWHEFEHGER